MIELIRLNKPFFPKESILLYRRNFADEKNVACTNHSAEKQYDEAVTIFGWTSYGG